MSMIIKEWPFQRGDQRGFTLLEVLVAVLVLTIGLLGLAGLQATAVRSNTSAYLRSQASILAYDIADRMRANRLAVSIYSYCGQNVNGAGCSGVAKQDVQSWLASLATTLPSGTGSITQAADLVTVTVQWDDSRGQQDPQLFSMVTEL